MILISKLQKMGRLKCHTQTFEDFYLSSSLIWLFGTNSPLKRHSKLWHSYLIVISCFLGFNINPLLWIVPYDWCVTHKKFAFFTCAWKNNHFRLLQAPFNNRNQQCHRTQNRNHFSRQFPNKIFSWIFLVCDITVCDIHLFSIFLIVSGCF